VKIAADLHTHTIASTHAFSTILENSFSAQQAGLTAIAITDHAPMIEDSPHIWHFNNLEVIPRILNNVIIIRGIEANIIDFDGNIDVPEYLHKSMEWVIASMHGPCITPGSIEDNTKGYIEIAKNPLIDLIGHPTTNEYVWDYEKGLKYIKEYGKFVEINESSIISRRGALENTVRMLRLCKKYEVPVIVNTDSHFCQRIGLTPVSFKIIEETDFPVDLIVNLEWERLKEHILSKHPDALK